MSPLEIDALIALGEKLFGVITAATATLGEIKANHPEVYAEISKAHALTGAHLDNAAAGRVVL